MLMTSNASQNFELIQLNASNFNLRSSYSNNNCNTYFNQDDWQQRLSQRVYQVMMKKHENLNEIYDRSADIYHIAESNKSSQT